MTTLPVLGDNLTIYFKEIAALPVLSPEREFELARRWYDERQLDAAHQLVVHNLRFVVKIALEYAKYGFRKSDLIQEGNVGLMQAVKRFNPHKGYRLISYAVWWIRAQIHDFILRSWSIVKVGTTRLQRRLFSRLQSSQKRLRHQIDAVDREMAENRSLAEEFDTTTDEVAQFRQRVQAKDLSIDVPLHDDGKVFARDRLVDPQTNQEEDLAARQTQSLLRARVSEAVERLDARDRFIVERRLLSDSPLTLDELGAHFGVSKERARQLEARVKKRLRETLHDCGEVCFG